MGNKPNAPDRRRRLGRPFWEIGSGAYGRRGQPYVPDARDGHRALQGAILWAFLVPVLLVVGLGRFGPDLHPSLESMRHAERADDALAEAMEAVHAFSFEAVATMDGSTLRLGDGSEVRLAVTAASDGVLQVAGSPAGEGSLSGSFTTWRDH